MVKGSKSLPFERDTCNSVCDWGGLDPLSLSSLNLFLIIGFCGGQI